MKKKKELFRSVIRAAGMLFVIGIMSPLLMSGGLWSSGAAVYQACFSEDCFRAETAQTPEQRGRGLMYRDSLGEKDGMLFIFDSPRPHGIWMKNMRMPLDILWLDSEKKIVDLKQNVPFCTNEPCTVYEPLHPAAYVLELKAGAVSRTGLKSGSKMTLKPLDSLDLE